MDTFSKSELETPIEFFKKLDDEFHFTLDPCATTRNAKCKKFYTKENDGLVQNWKNEIVFCNPPQDRREVVKWVKKCYEEWKYNKAKIVMLLPVRTDTKYFHSYIYNNAELRFVKGRIKFEINGEKFNNGSPVPSMLVIFK